MTRITDRQLAWLSICVSTAGILVSVEIYELGHYYLTPVAFATLLSLPRLLRIIGHTRPSIGKGIRILRSRSLWRSIRVLEYVLQVAVMLVVVITAKFLYNLFVLKTFNGEEIFLNVLALDLVVLLIMVLRFRPEKDMPLLIRENLGTGAVYRYDRGELRHIPDDVTFGMLGYSHSDVQEVPSDEFAKYHIGAPLKSITDEDFVRATGTREVYAIVNGERCHVPNALTLAFLERMKGATIPVQEKPRADVALMPLGTPLRSVLEL